MFKEVPAQFDFPAEERRILEFWEKNRIYEKSLQRRKGSPPFLFYEGPPTANGLPHPGHCLTRAIKDLFPRYKTMCGYYCERKAGWDTHGLPVEVEVCKELGIHSKEEIEQYGVEPFIRKCLESVFRYTKEWEQLTKRLGFWVNLDEAYVTYHQSYVESVWWALKTLFDTGLLYQGHKIVWWWAQGGTALSSGEVGQGYREVDDPSVFVRFRAAYLEGDRRASRLGIDKNTSLLVWTTTPWTLPSNMYAAVNTNFEYALVQDEKTGEKLVLAAPLVESIAKKVKAEWKTITRFPGGELVGLRYTPPFDFYYKDLGQKTARRKIGGEAPIAWDVVAADFVSLDAGTGLVHEAPAFGEVDFDLWKQLREWFSNAEEVPLLCAVAPDGKFTADAGPKYAGRWVKEADKDIIRDLKERGLLLHQEQYRHDYPFCWRAEEDPLIQYPRKSWFIRTKQFKDDMLANNERINWLPDHIKQGRFGKFLESNVDWALSRERYWGTPLPIWVCEKTGYMEAVASYDELLKKDGVQGVDVWDRAKQADPALSEHLKVHKPYIDEITYQSPKDAGARMRRVPDVIDCWFDSGAMPFAQWGFPHTRGSIERFAKSFPADFISEALDQTRGWFYSLLSISTLLFSSAAMESIMAAGAVRSMRSRAEKRYAAGQINETAYRRLLEVADRLQATSECPPTQSATDENYLDDVTLEYPMPFRNCIVLGLLMGEDGLKMSKSKKNYKEPSYIFEHEGADAMRWLFFSGQAPWTSIRFQESAIAESQREFLIRLYNVYSFFVIYANIDRWTPLSRHPVRLVFTTGRSLPVERQYLHKAIDGVSGIERVEGWLREEEDELRARLGKASGQLVVDRSGVTELDRWIISELNRTVKTVRASMDAYDNFAAARQLNEFVDALSNWYVRRTRDRFWKSRMELDKHAAYEVLYECLVTMTLLAAPFTPFFADALYQNLVGSPQSYIKTPRLPESVHLCDYPVADESLIDEQLSEEMAIVRDIVSLGRAARAESKIRVRQPLPLVEIVLADRSHTEWLRGHEALFRDELNVEQVEFTADADHYVNYQVKPNFKSIGPKFGKLAPAIKAALASAKDPAAMRRQIDETGRATLEVSGQTVELTTEDVQVELTAKPGWAAAQGRTAVVVLKTEITDQLRQEGLARELVHHVQQIRKEMDLKYEQRIELGIKGNATITSVAEAFTAYITSETLATALTTEPLRGVAAHHVNVEGHEVDLFVRPVS